MLILQNHRHDLPPLGTVDVQKDRLVIRFNRPVTKDEFFKTFGNCGAMFTKFYVDENDEGAKIESIQEAEILEFSVVA